MGEKLLGRVPTYLTIADKCVKFGAMTSVVASAPVVFKHAQKADFASIAELEGDSLDDVFIALFKRQLQIAPARRAARPLFWLFKQMLWCISVRLDRIFAGRSVSSLCACPAKVRVVRLHGDDRWLSVRQVTSFRCAPE